MVGLQSFPGFCEVSCGWLLLCASDLVFDKQYIMNLIILTVHDQTVKRVQPMNRFLVVKHRKRLVGRVNAMLDAS